jgi:NhaP-type Na+/H+ or K+/H+ antiporter
LRLAELQQIGRVLRNLITIGALVTWLISASGAYLVLGLNLGLSLLLGAILVVTGPTVILPLLRHIQPVRRISSILKWEGIVIDPIGATLAVLIFEAVRAGDVGTVAGLVVLGVLKTLVVGAVLGLFGAAVIVVLLRRYWVPDYLHNTVALMVVVLVFTLSDLLQKEAGLLTVTVMGVALANQKYASIRHIVEFK